MANSYTVTEEDFDTRIREHAGDGGDYDTFEEAREAAIAYLEGMIAGCRGALGRIVRAANLADDLGAPPPESGDQPTGTSHGAGGEHRDLEGAVPSGQAFYKTVYEVVVLSDEPPESGGDLDQIAHDINEGPCVGDVRLVSTGRVTREEMDRLLVEVGGDPGFFPDEDEDDPPA